MTVIKGTFVPSTIYNRLPHIYEVSDAPESCSQDLRDIRALLAKHNVPDGVCVRLIHKHFDAIEGEVMAFKKVPATPDGATVVVMRPVANPDPNELKPLNYFVDYGGSLQAYEYTASDQVTDLSDHLAFVDEFCRLVSERGLQKKFGLKLKSEREKISFTEFEFPAERSTVMIPSGLPVPEGHYDISVRTDWTAAAADIGNNNAASSTETLPPVNLNCAHCFHSYCPHCSHAYCDHCFHCFHDDQHGDSKNGLFLGGQKLEAGTAIWNLVNEVMRVW